MPQSIPHNHLSSNTNQKLRKKQTYNHNNKLVARQLTTNTQTNRQTKQKTQSSAQFLSCCA